MTYHSTHRQYLTMLGILVALLLLALSAFAQETTNEAQGQDVNPSIGDGEMVFEGRLRYWYANDAAAKASHAFTFGTNFGYRSPTYKGFQIYLEGESVMALTPDLFFDGLNDQIDRTVVTDVETIELNQAQIYYTGQLGETKVQFRLGRQAAIVEDERFIGNVSARQDDQTFDAGWVKVQNDKRGFSFEYAYMYQINRLLAQVGDWRSNSHAFMMSYYKNPLVRVGLFAHLFDFKADNPGQSLQTFGFTIDRSEVPQDRVALTYKTAFAYQTDYADNPIAYESLLFNGEVGVSLPYIAVLNVGYELATSDNGVAAFQFPLSTGQRLHRISDKFISPPADGLHNPYVTAEFRNLVWGIGGWLGYHTYLSQDESTLLGQEIDVVLYRQIVPDLLRAELTYASFLGEEERFSDLNIFALDVVFEL
ncbi:MAG: alginate export family protein [Bacteroidota bacterium]